MEAMGSVTDKHEFPREALLKMIDIAIKKGKFKSITLETHITQIDEELVKYIYEKNQQLPEEQRKQIEKTMNERREQREKDGRRGFRPRRFNRRGFRGRRGFRRGFRGFRGGNRNFRVARNTGGNRRGAPRRGAQQRGMRGQRRGNNK